MKKLLAIIISVCLVITGMTTTLTAGVSAATDEYEDTSLWGRTTSGVKEVTVASDMLTNVYVYNDSSVVTAEGGKSVKIVSNTNQFFGFKLQGLKANTAYRLTFKHKVLEENKVNATATYYKFFGYGVYTAGEGTAYSSTYGTIIGTSLSNTTNTGNQSFNTWNTTTLTFNTADDTNALFLAKLYAQIVYFDDIVLEELGLENTAYWGASSGKDLTVGDSVITLGSSASYATGSDYTNGSDYSIKMAASWSGAKSMGLKLQGLKANTPYRFSFDHKVVTANKVADYYKLFCSGLYTKGTTEYAYSPYISITGNALAQGENISYNIDTWNDYSLTFTTGTDTDVYFLARLYANAIYFDNIVIEEITHLAQDFESYTTTTSASLSVIEPDESIPSGKKVLYYDGSETNAQFIINPKADNMPLLTQLAAAGESFTVSLKYRVLSGSPKFYLWNSTNGTNYGSHSSTNPINYKEVTLTGTGWQELTTTFSVKTEDNGGANYQYPIMVLNGGTVYIDYLVIAKTGATYTDVDVPQITTAYNNTFALRSAAASSTGKNGVRVYNSITDSWIADANIVEFGSVATRTARLEGAALTLDSVTAGIATKGVAYSADAEISKLWSDENGVKAFTSYLVNIPESKYGEYYSVRAYAIDSNGKVYYGAVLDTVCIFAFANAIDRSSQSDDDAAAFYSFITAENAAEYSQWCSDNGCAVGELYNAEYAGE